MKVGITERGDAAIHLDWLEWVKDGNPAILISKDPVKLSKILWDEFPTTDPNVIIHCTITGWGESKMEPGVGPAKDQIDRGLLPLICRFGAGRVVLRIDPIIPTVGGNQKAISVLEYAIAKAGSPDDFRLRVSFVDLYPHAKKRIEAAGYKLPWQSFHAPIDRRACAWASILQMKPNTEICSEPDFKCTGCVSQLDLNIFGIPFGQILKGQRKECQCLALKTELLKNRGQCSHGCLYCYWK